MPRRVCSKWLSYRGTMIYCIDFSGCGADRQSLKVELEAAEAVICHQGADSLLATVDVSQTEMGAELAAFIQNSTARAGKPFRKMAFLGVSPLQKLWYGWSRHISWPACARFFDEYEKAKAWLVEEK
jgi:hypothetical protein